MNFVSKKSMAVVLAAAIAVPATGLAAQEQGAADGEVLTTVYAPELPAMDTMSEGPDVEGFISARKGERMQVTSEDGTVTTLFLHNDTRIRASGGFLGLNRTSLGSDQLLNGLPVVVETMQWEGGLVANRIKLKDDDLETAAMIRNGTAQRFAEQGAMIDENTTDIAANAAATEALRGRVGDIDNYNIKGTTNVYFDTGKYNLSAQARNELCSIASQADSMNNALLLVVGYTDTTGSYEVNQTLSERRAGRVTNYLQQQCGWKPWRMLTPTGMAEADPAADNTTAEGRAQNRRVAVNILVSKSVDGL